MPESYLERRHKLERLSVPELVTLLMEYEESRRKEEEMKREGKEMKVGDIIIVKKIIREIGGVMMHKTFQINAKRGNKFCVTPVVCRPEFVSNDLLSRARIKKEDKKEHVRYNISFDNNKNSCWEHKDVLYESYEKFDKDKIYEIPF